MGSLKNIVGTAAFPFVEAAMAEPGTLVNTGRSPNGLAIAGLSLAAVRELLEPPAGPCLTLSLPTHRNVPENRVDLPSYRHLVESLDMALSLSRSRDEIERLLRPFYRLASDRRFWAHTRDGLAVFGAEGWARAFLLPKPVKPLALVSTRFHTLPVLRQAAAIDRYHVLTLTSREAHIFEGRFIAGAVDPLEPLELEPVALRGVAELATQPLNRSSVIDDELLQPHRMRRQMNAAGIVHGGFRGKQDDVDTDTEIFFRHVDELIRERVSLPAGLPLVLVALPELAAVFRGLSQNRLLLEDYVPKDVHLLPVPEIAALVLPIFTADRCRRIDRECRLFELASNRGLAAGDLAGIAQAAVAGRVATLLVEEDRFEPGWLDRTTGAIHGDGEVRDDLARSGDTPAVRTEDLIGAVAETVLLHGGELLSLEHGRMPTTSGLAAIYRY